MLRSTIAVVFCLCIFHTVSSAQSNPATTLHVGGIILDGGSGLNYSIQVPAMQSSINYTLPNIPPNAPTAGYVGQGVFLGQTLYWNGSMWMPSSVLMNDGTNLIASGSLTALNFIGNGAGLTSLPSAQLTGVVPLVNLGGITSAQLAPNAGIVDAQLVSISGSKIVGSLPALDGSSVTNLSPSNLSPGTAAINISGNASTATSATTITGSISESQVTNLTSDLSAKATDASVVHQTGDESIAGVKTFTSTIQGNISGTAGSATSFAGNIPESQVTNLTTDLAVKATDASVVHQTGAESIAGVKTFTSTIQGNISGTAGSATNFTGLGKN